MLRRLRAGDRAGAAEAILLWNRPAALIPRRGAEYDQFRTPYAQALPRARRGDAAPIAIPSPPVSSLPAPRRPVPRARIPVPAHLVPPLPAPLPALEAPPAPGVWARLWSALRAGGGRTG
ncbi:hypothetical protein CFIICLFH_3662 [Methylobacterium goesingense]|nr:hypothetical protein CFIICLFH_3662 [Methylobacterium goesingense]